MEHNPALMYNSTTGNAPTRAHNNDAGIDIRSAENVTLHPGQGHLVSTGLSIALPENTVGDIRPRSGLAAKHGVTVLNAPGTVDEGYRGEIMVNLINLGDSPYRVAVGDRIAQLVVIPIVKPTLIHSDDLGETVRGASGHGSTGY